MRILQINAVNQLSSTGRTTTELAEALKQRGHHVINAHSAGPVDGFSYLIGGRLEHKLHGLCSRIFGLQGYFSKSSTKKLLKYIADNRFDIVHLRNLHANYINLPMLLKFLAENDIATVVTLHDCWFFTGKCMYYSLAGCYKWQNKCGGCPQLKEGNPSWFFDRTEKILEDKKKLFQAIPRLAVIGVSDWITNEAKESILKDAEIIKRIYNWINTEIFRPVDAALLRQKLNLRDKFVILGVAGVWRPGGRKGFDRFLELAGSVSEDTRIVLVGEVEKGLELPGNILVVGSAGNVHELAEYYSMADVFLNLSVEETFGKVSAEALACGTPVITSEHTANPEIVNKASGLILEDLSLKSMLKAIKIVQDNGKAYYSTACRQYAQEVFDGKILIDEYIEVYQQLSKKKRTSLE